MDDKTLSPCARSHRDNIRDACNHLGVMVVLGMIHDNYMHKIEANGAGARKCWPIITRMLRQTLYAMQPAIWQVNEEEFGPERAAKQRANDAEQRRKHGVTMIIDREEYQDELAAFKYSRRSDVIELCEQIENGEYHG